MGYFQSIYNYFDYYYYYCQGFGCKFLEVYELINQRRKYISLLLIVMSLVYILGITMFGASDVTTDLVSSNQITDYSFVTQPFKLDQHNVILRCATGLGPSGKNANTGLGGWYFNGIQISLPTKYHCHNSVLEVRGANGRNYPGMINLYLCGTFTTIEEGVYSCIMMNSSMMNQTMRVGVYCSGRSESLDVYPSPHC